jgi:hypothetical protein
MLRFTAPSETFLAGPVRWGFENQPLFLHAGEYTDLALDDSIRCDLN